MSISVNIGIQIIVYILKHAVPLGFYEADTLEFSSILICECLKQSLYTHGGWQDAVVIKSEIKIERC